MLLNNLGFIIIHTGINFYNHNNAGNDIAIIGKGKRGQ